MLDLDIQRDINTDRHTHRDRQTQADIDRQTERHRLTVIQQLLWADAETQHSHVGPRHTGRYRQTHTETQRQTDSGAVASCSGPETYSKTQTQIDTHRQTDRQWYEGHKQLTLIISLSITVQDLRHTDKYKETDRQTDKTDRQTHLSDQHTAYTVHSCEHSFSKCTIICSVRHYRKKQISQINEHRHRDVIYNVQLKQTD